MEDENALLEGWFNAKNFVPLKSMLFENEKPYDLEIPDKTRDTIMKKISSLEEKNAYEGVCELIKDVVPTLNRNQIEFAVELRKHRIIALTQMKLSKIAYKELEMIENFDIEYRDLPKIRNNRRGKVSGFDLSFLKALIPFYMGNNLEVIDRLSLLLLELNLNKYTESDDEPKEINSIRKIIVSDEIVRILTELEEYEAAENIMHQIVSQNETNARLYYNQIKVLIQDNRISEAKLVLEHARTLPDFPTDTVDIFLKLISFENILTPLNTSKQE